MFDTKYSTEVRGCQVGGGGGITVRARYTGRRYTQGNLDGFGESRYNGS